MNKQIFAAIVALLGPSGAAVAQTASETEPAASSCAPPKVAGKVVDLQAVPGSDLLTVPVEINGTPKQFLLDIGTDPDQIAQTVVTDLHLPEVNQSPASNAMTDLNTPFQFGAGAGFYDVKGSGKSVNYQTRVRVGSFAIAGTTVQSLEFLVADDRDMGKSKPYDGLLTGSLFPQYDMNFDFGEKKFTFLDPTGCTDPNQVAYWPHQVVATIPMAISNGKIAVPVTIDGHVINAVLDTGSARTVMRRDIAELTLGLKSGDMTADGDNEDGMGQRIYLHTFPQIAFGGVFANNVPALIQTNSMVRKLNKTPMLGSRAQFAADPSERIPDLALGMDVLHQLHIYAAFNQNQLYVTPAK